jgi:hypothetical protein
MQYDRLGIPMVVVTRQGTITAVPANTVFAAWLSDRVGPISGPKSAHLIAVFEPPAVNADVAAFVAELAHAYHQFGLGRLLPLGRGDALRAAPKGGAGAALAEFYGARPVAEFQRYPVVALAFGEPVAGGVHAHVLSLRPRALAAATPVEIAALAFEIYTRMRAASGLEGTAAPYSVRFQPPFLLRRYEDCISLDFLWNDAMRVMVVSDDIGSVLFATEPMPPGRSLDAARKVVENTREHYERAGCLRAVTLSVFADGIGDELMHAVVAAFGPECQVFAIFPAPAVQARFGEAFDDDAIVHEDGAQARNGMCEPVAGCFVISPNHGAYKVAIYQGGGRDELVEYAKRVSALSWLTVRPGAEKRAVALPPQLVAMIRQSKTSVFDVARFEFLPSCDVINSY